MKLVVSIYMTLIRFERNLSWFFSLNQFYQCIYDYVCTEFSKQVIKMYIGFYFDSVYFNYILRD